MTKQASYSLILVSTLMFVMTLSHLARAESLNDQHQRQDSIVSLDSIDNANLAKRYSDQVSGQVELNDDFDLAFTAQLNCQVTLANSETISHADYSQLRTALDNLHADHKIALQRSPAIDSLQTMILNMITILTTYQNINQSCLIDTFSTELITKANLQS